MAETSIKIEGMSCQHCVMAVKKAITGSNREAVDKLDDVQPVATPAQPEAFEAEKKVLNFTLST